MEAKPDLPVQRFVPDPELVAIAHNAMLDDESPRLKFMRQRWEEASAATRVALDAWRSVWPIDAELIRDDLYMDARAALSELEDAHLSLDRLSDFMLGRVTVAVQRGEITTREELEEELHG